MIIIIIVIVIIIIIIIIIICHYYYYYYYHYYYYYLLLLLLLFIIIIIITIITFIIIIVVVVVFVEQWLKIVEEGHVLWEDMSFWSTCVLDNMFYGCICLKGDKLCRKKYHMGGHVFVECISSGWHILQDDKFYLKTCLTGQCLT